MIFQTVANLFYNIITTLLNGVNISSFPADVIDSIDEYLIPSLINGVSILNYFVNLNLFKILFIIFISITSAEYIYYFVMWIIKKIPLASIE